MMLEESYQSPVSIKMNAKLEEVSTQTKQVQTHFEDSLYFLKRQINELEELVTL